MSTGVASRSPRLRRSGRVGRAGAVAVPLTVGLLVVLWVVGAVSGALLSGPAPRAARR